MITQLELRSNLEKEKEAIKEDDDEDDDWYDRIEQVDLRIQNLSDELKEVKKNQMSFFGEKKKSMEAMNASRSQRAQEISKANENWSDFVYYLKKNPEFRKSLGYELESMRLGMKEEYIRLSQVHEYGDGELDHPILNSDVVQNKEFADVYDKTILSVKVLTINSNSIDDSNEQIDWAAEVRKKMIEEGKL
jgi:hypothetical protein